MTLLAMNSLYKKKGNDGYLWSEAYMFNAMCYKDNYFSKRKFKLFNGLFHWVYLVFSTHLLSIANMFAMRYLWKKYVTKHCDKWQQSKCPSKTTCLQNKIVLHNSRVVWRPLNCTCTVVGKVSSAATGKVKTSTDTVLGLSYFLAKIKARKCRNEITILQMKF